MMKIQNLHDWSVSIEDASAIQTKFRPRISLVNDLPNPIRFIAACDLALDPEKNIGYGAVLVYSWPDLKIVENKTTIQPLTFPYVPGFLSFREAPVLIKAIELLEKEPDLFIFDGQGIAHPRGMGIAAHIGLLLDKPSIGCGKSKLYGSYKEPGPSAGDTSVLYGKDKKQIGIVLRTKLKCNPVFISPGNKIDFETSLEIIRKCTDEYRIPKPMREADRFVGEFKRTNSETTLTLL